MKLTDKEVINRLDISDRWLKKYRDADQAASSRYIDVNAPSVGFQDDWHLEDDWFNPEADAPEWIPIGQVNPLRDNNETKIAGIAMGIPSLHVRANEDPQNGGIPGAGEVVARTWQKVWFEYNWKRETQAALQKRGIIGMGVVWYRWDALYGFCIEHVPLKRLLLDPHATNLYRMEWGGVKVRMSLRRIMALYDPNGENGFFGAEAVALADGKTLDTTVRTIKLYFDRDEEVHVYQDKVIHRSKNLYGKVPLLPVEGFIDPRTRLMPLGDAIFAAGLNQNLADLASVASNMAKHGGQITLANANSFDDTTAEALKNGAQQQILFVKGPLNPQALPVHRISAEQLSPAYGEAYQQTRMAMDAIQGVTPGQRGEQIPNVTATQSVMVESKGGARAVQDQTDVEVWYTRIAQAFVDCMQKFSGPTEDNPGTGDARNVWRAFKAVYDVKVVEGSTSFQNPAQDKQSAMQLYTTVVQSYELFIGLATQGVVDTIPNLKQYADDMLRAFSRQNTESYWMPAPQKPQSSEPPVELVRALSQVYKDSPPDVQRQIEQDFQLQPSQLGSSPQGDTGEGAAGAVDQQQQQAHDMQMQAMDQGHQAASMALEHAHQLRLEQMKQQHASQVKLAEMGHQQRLATLQQRGQRSLARQKARLEPKKEPK